MKFAAKYEVQQRVATGPVETFTARDRVTNQKVILHIFRCSRESANRLTIQGVSEAFTQLAPALAAPIIDAGMIDGTTFGYLVIAWSSDEALAVWVRSYQAKLDAISESRGSDTAAVIHRSDQNNRPAATGVGIGPVSSPSATVKSTSGSTPMFASREPGPTAEKKSQQSPIGPGEGSGFFPRNEDVIADVPADDSRMAGGDFTRQFLSISGDDRVKAAQPLSPSATDLGSKSPISGGPVAKDSFGNWESEPQLSHRSTVSSSETANPVTPTVSAPLMEKVESGQFTKLFFRDIEPSERTTSDQFEPPGKVSAAGAGEFTSFFHGPFSGERAVETPEISVDFAPREKTPGDFTRVFGPSEIGPSHDRQQSRSSLSHSSLVPQAPSTKLFEPPKPTMPAAPSETDWRPQQPVEPAIPDVPASSVDRGATVVSAQPPTVEPFREHEIFPTSPLHKAEPLDFQPDASSNATKVFYRPDAGPNMHESASPTGPSQWTIFQSTQNVVPIVPAEPSAQAELPRQGWSNPNPAIAGPLTPPVPSVSAPAAPAVVPPQVPYSMPQQPVMPASSVPVGPEPAARPKATPSFWPLIIALNVLFMLAVLLVLYFALRH